MTSKPSVAKNKIRFLLNEIYNLIALKKIYIRQIKDFLFLDVHYLFRFSTVLHLVNTCEFQFSKREWANGNKF